MQASFSLKCTNCLRDFDIDLIPYELPSCEHLFCMNCIKKVSNSKNNTFTCKMDRKICKDAMSKLNVSKIYETYGGPKPILPVERTFRIFCDIHTDKKIKFLCKHHETFICSYCAWNHADHKTNQYSSSLILKDLQVLETKLNEGRVKMDNLSAKIVKMRTDQDRDKIMNKDIHCLYKEIVTFLRSPVCDKIQEDEVEKEFPFYFKPKNQAGENEFAQDSHPNFEMIKKIVNRTPSDDKPNLLSASAKKFPIKINKKPSDPNESTENSSNRTSEEQKKIYDPSNPSDPLILLAETENKPASKQAVFLKTNIKSFEYFEERIEKLTKNFSQKLNQEKSENLNNTNETIELPFLPIESDESLLQKEAAYRQEIKSKMCSISNVFDSAKNKDFFVDMFAPAKISHIALLFRATEHAFSSKIFHKKCDLKGPTIVLIKADNDKIFGGYSTNSWTSPFQCSFYSAPKSFLFSFDRKKKIPLIEEVGEFYSICTKNVFYILITI